MFLTIKSWLVHFILTSQNAAGADVAETVYKTMRFSSDGAGMTVVNTILGYCYGLFNPLAFTLIVVYLMVGIIKMLVAGHELDANVIVRTGVALIIADVLIANDGWIAGNLLWLADKMGTVAMDLMQGIVYPEVESSLAQQSQLAMEGEAALNAFSVFQLALYFLGSMIALLVSQLARFAIMLTCYTAKAEFILRLAFAPIGFSGFADIEQRAGSGRYLRKLIASALYCMSIVMIVWIIALLQTSQTDMAINNPGDAGSFVNLLQNAFLSVVVPFASVGAISIAKSAISDVFGT